MTPVGDERVTACKSCGSCRVYRRERQHPPWRCRACGEEADSVRYRPRKTTGPGDGIAIRTQLLIAEEAADDDRPEGDDSWRQYYERGQS